MIAVPHNAHHPRGQGRLERGLHTLLEKPMTLDPAHARELIELARARDCELLIDYPWHYNRQVLEIRERLARGELGLDRARRVHVRLDRPRALRRGAGDAPHGHSATR